MKKQIRHWTLVNLIVMACTEWLIFGHLAINPAAAQNSHQEDGKNTISVVVTPSKRMTFEKRIETYGNVATKNYSLISARIPGVIDDIFVEEGDYVIKDKTSLFQIDKTKVTQAWEIARHAVAVADYGHRARMATVARIEVDLEKAGIDYERFKRLYEEDQAVTKNALESQESRYKQLKAALDEARAGADLTLRQMEQAQSQLIIAQKDLEDSLVKAPITGHISERLHEPGEMVGSGIPVLRIDDLSELEVSAFLPDQYYSDIRTGKTKMHMTINNINAGEMPIIYRSPTIDNKMRNFKVGTLIRNPPEGIAPGAMAKIGVIMERRKAIGLPKVAILRRTSGQVVFLAEQGRARMVRVKMGLEMDGWIEVISENIRENSPIITMGQDQLEDGSLISIIKEDNV